MASKVQLRRDTYANWASSNPTLSQGEQALETDTGLVKVGTGSTVYTSLEYDLLNTYRLATNGSAVGPAIADFFPSASFPMDAGGVYEMEWDVWFVKTTTNPVVFTITTSVAASQVAAYYVGTPVGGIGTVGAPQTASAIAASTATALPATGSLTTAVNHHFVIKAIVEANVSSASTAKLQITNTTAGTTAAQRGSTFTVRRLPVANIGAFA